MGSENEANRIIWNWREGYPPDSSPATLLPYQRERLAELIAAALRAAATVPEGYVRTGTTDHKLLGTLPMTADRCVIGDWATPFVLHLSGDVHQGTTRTITYSWTDTTPGRRENRPYDGSLCFSTREAAEAAKEATKQ